MPADLEAVLARHRRGFNERDFELWREVFDESVEMLVDGIPLRGLDAVVGYGVSSVNQSPGRYIASERIVAVSDDTVVAEISLVTSDPAGGHARPQGTSYEIWQLRDGRIVSGRSVYMPEPADRADAVGVPIRSGARVIAEEHAALRRVAALLARGVGQAELCAAVTEEIGRLMAADTTSLIRFERDDTVTLVAAWSARQVGLPVGSNRPVDDELRAMREAGRSWRWGPAEFPLTGSFAEEANALGVRTYVGVPMVVDGRVWGFTFVSSTDQPFADDAETRLAGFTELVASAIGNAQARTELRGFAEEQAALRRVATLVARATAPEEVFTAVAEEIGRLLAVDFAILSRTEPDATQVSVGSWSGIGGHVPFPVGTRVHLGGRNAVSMVVETGRPARMDDYSDASGPVGAAALSWRLRSAVAVPINVEGRLWGVISVASERAQPMPPDIEVRLTGFTELVATAIANAQARVELRDHAEEQAALRRVATLVAQSASPEEVFDAVAAEAGWVFSADYAGVTRYEANGARTVVGAWSEAGGAPPVPVGTQFGREERNASTSRLVFDTARPARIEDYADADAFGLVTDAIRERGIRSAVGAPINVEGRLWGSLSISSTGDELLPPDTEERLARFAELVATALADSQARVELRGFAEEQAALRRVATLVAQAAPPEDVFAAATEETGRVLDVDFTVMGRYDSDGATTILGMWTRIGAPVPIPVGGRLELGGQNVITRVLETGRPTRLDNHVGASGAAADLGKGWGLRSLVGVPINVEGRLWGFIMAATVHEDPLPADTEARLARFTELVATALANTQARVELRAFAEEQAALRRVATLVARAAPPKEVFAAVTAEVGRVLGADFTTMSRYEAAGTITAVGLWSSTGAPPPVSVGDQLPLGGKSVTTLVLKTGRPARVDYAGDASGAVADAAREWGMYSAVGVPIDVEGRVWGIVTVGSTRERSLPTDTEARLTAFTELVATAVANADAQAALTASRARIVAAADTTRSRIERDLHDGAQQRLVSLALQLREMQAAAPAEAVQLKVELDDVAAELGGVLDDLRELARGLHPAVLAEGGLRPALKTLARRSAVPVRVDLRADKRLPEPVELAAYYVVAEALTNTAKHAAATVIDVQLEIVDGMLHVRICDDGRGGADLRGGTGLVGLNDRVEALGGRLALRSPPDEGTTIDIRLPIATSGG